MTSSYRREAIRNFNHRILPKRVRDITAEELYKEKTGLHKHIYRKFVSNEPEYSTASSESESDHYHLFHLDISQYAHFGLGTGVYFMQLLILAISMLAGAVMISPTIQVYGALSTSSSSLMQYSAECTSHIIVNASSFKTTGNLTMLVPVGLAEFRDCRLPKYTALLDIIVCLFLSCVCYALKYLEKKLVLELDEAVQTSQDYGIVVENPNEDSEDPDEWYEFFSKFGVVRYVSVVRKNADLCRLLLQRHRVIRKINHYLPENDAKTLIRKAKYITIDKRPFWDFSSPKAIEETLTAELQMTNKALEEEYNELHVVSKVFIVFEMQRDQRSCLEKLNMSILAMGEETEKFRGKQLYVSEPTEPDNINWLGLEATPLKRYSRSALSFILSGAFLAASFSLTEYVITKYPEYLAFVVAVVRIFYLSR